MATLRAATTKGTITLNPIGGILCLPREGREGKRVENKASKMAFLTGQQASKWKENHEAPTAESSKITPELRRKATTDRHCLDFNLAQNNYI